MPLPEAEGFLALALQVAASVSDNGSSLFSNFLIFLTPPTVVAIVQMGDPRQVLNQPFDKGTSKRAGLSPRQSPAPRSSPAFSPGATLATPFVLPHQVSDCCRQFHHSQN